MFRKSVTFFILLAMLWILLWVNVADQSPNHFSFSDVLRASFLLFSLMAFAFAVLMLIIRYKGVDLISRIIPHAGLILWLGKHAFEYSQPKTILYCAAGKNLRHLLLVIETNKRKHEIHLNPEHVQIADLGYLVDEPILHWQTNSGEKVNEPLPIKDRLKKLGKNVTMDVTIEDERVQFSCR